MIFFILKKLFLILAHQNNLKISKKLILNKNNKKIKTFSKILLKYKNKQNILMVLRSRKPPEQRRTGWAGGKVMR